jgi:hypothetical protein
MFPRSAGMRAVVRNGLMGATIIYGVFHSDEDGQSAARCR